MKILLGAMMLLCWVATMARADQITGRITAISGSEIVLVTRLGLVNFNAAPAQAGGLSVGLRIGESVTVSSRAGITTSIIRAKPQQALWPDDIVGGD